MKNRRVSKITESTRSNGVAGKAENNGRSRHEKLKPAPVKSRRISATESQPVPKPIPPSRLTPAELDAFRELLLSIRRQLVGNMDSMEGEALRKNRTDASGDLSLMPIHMADIGTDNYEQEFTIGLVQNERETIKEIDAALQRIADGTYGVCLGTHKPIPKARLRAKPWARYCIEYRRAEEQKQRRRA